jgi:hypothetical protein
VWDLLALCFVSSPAQQEMTGASLCASTEFHRRMVPTITYWPAIQAVIEVVTLALTAVCRTTKVSTLDLAEGVLSNDDGTTYDRTAFDSVRFFACNYCMLIFGCASRFVYIDVHCNFLAVLVGISFDGLFPLHVHHGAVLISRSG